LSTVPCETTTTDANRSSLSANGSSVVTRVRGGRSGPTKRWLAGQSLRGKSISATPVMKNMVAVFQGRSNTLRS
jgi:hypothetical protein